MKLKLLLIVTSFLHKVKAAVNLFAGSKIDAHCFNTTA